MNEEPKTCETCRHFHLHYVRTGSTRYIPLNQGHCDAPWCRDKQAATPACQRFSRRSERKKTK